MWIGILLYRLKRNQSIQNILDVLAGLQLTLGL